MAARVCRGQVPEHRVVRSGGDPRVLWFTLDRDLVTRVWLHVPRYLIVIIGIGRDHRPVMEVG